MTTIERATDSVSKTFESIASNIRIPGAAASPEGGDLEGKLRAFLKSSASTMMTPLSLKNVILTENIRHSKEDDSEFDALVSSIRAAGVVQPPIVTIREGEEGVEVVCVAGHRRIAAAIAAGLEKLTCVVRKFSGDDVRLISTVIENTHRKNLHPFEFAKAIRELTEKGQTFEELESLFDRNQWNLRRFNKMNDWTPATRDIVEDHPEVFTPGVLLQIAARAMTPEQVENVVREKVTPSEPAPKPQPITERVELYCQAKGLSEEQKTWLFDALKDLGLIKTKGTKIAHTERASS